MTTKIPGTCYLVGGAVRDRFLGLPVRDEDFVVVGASTEQMAAAGFRQVGKDFPVFLSADGTEYALARAESKTAPGYHGFVCDANPGITLEQDLERRDLTINAMALGDNDQLVDPFGGRADLDAGVLRHVSPAFAEDPVRILRVARFMARYAERGFVVADDTMAMMRTMVEAGEVDALVPERIWAEFAKAITEPRPSAFLSTLRACGALARILPEVDALYGVPQVATHHPEVDTGIHTEMVLDQAVRLAPGNSVVAFAALTHDLGKALTPIEDLPRHPGHEKSGLEPLNGLIARWRVPVEHAAVARAVCVQHLNAHRVFEVRPGTLMELILAVDGLRRPERWEAFILACEADKRGRLGMENGDYPQAAHLRAARAAAVGVSSAPLRARGLEGEALGEALMRERIAAIHKIHQLVRKPEPPRPPRPRP